MFWPMLFVAILTVLFFTGGWALDYFASEHGIKYLTQHPEISEARFQEYLKFQVARIQQVHEAAKPLYDIAKVSLGALIGCLSQLMLGSAKQIDARRQPQVEDAA